MPKRVITGGPGTGKTTKAGKHAAHTDDLIHLGWEPAIDKVASMLGTGGPEVIEGVQVARGLRKWLEDNPTGKPCDEVVWLTKPKEQQTRGQAIMHKGIETVMKEIEPELRKRGVQIVKER